MITVRPYETLGTMNIGWLDAHYHFSFANYHDPRYMSLGPLRVINDDIVRVGGGFDPHPHHDMEIITYVREGAITHKDSLGNEGVTRAGDVQIMSAGTGIVHGEWNKEGEDTRLYQIWIYPRNKGNTPRWETRQFPKEHEGLQLLVSGEKADGALTIDSDAAIWGGHIAEGKTHEHALAGAGYLLVSKGSVNVNGHDLRAGDGAQLVNEKKLLLAAHQPSEVLLIDLPRVQ
ncbi:MAG: pirin family protein [Alphaproteobacteria bacterium]|nr:pirin family protein [Alphaproteobacteria bacterium]